MQTSTKREPREERRKESNEEGEATGQHLDKDGNQRGGDLEQSRRREKELVWLGHTIIQKNGGPAKN